MANPFQLNNDWNNFFNRGSSGGSPPSYDPANPGNDILARLSPDQRRTLYKEQLNPQSYNQLINAGVPNELLVQDINALFGTNFNPLHGGLFSQGLTTEEFASSLASGQIGPNQLEQQASLWGFEAGDVADVYNFHHDQNISPLQVSQYSGLPHSNAVGAFDVPTDAYPSSTSSSRSSSSSFSGIDWSRPIAAGLQEQILSQAQQLPEMAEALPGRLDAYFRNLMQDALGRGAFTGTLNTLAERGVLDSTVAGDALSKTASHAMQEIGEKAFQSELAGLRTQMEVPEMLAAIADLDRISQSSSSGSSHSSSSNPLAPYQVMAQMLGLL